MRGGRKIAATLAKCAVALLVSTGGAPISEARACGGTFMSPSSANAVVTGHRMVFTTSPSRTVLWDQISFSGTPTEFGWVLPVAPGAYVEESSDAWFEALDAVTTTRVTAPDLRCAMERGSGIGCMGGVAGESKASAMEGRYGADWVDVIHRGTVGPYETVTLRSAEARALRTWLTTNGYVVPADIDPIIDAYIAEGSDFIALKLRPSVGVAQMKPVRVVTPGGPPTLPLRMVAAGTGSAVDVVLFVIGEGRFGLRDLTEAKIDLGALRFDFDQGDSNYLDLRREALAENEGATYLTTFAASSPFDRQYISAEGGMAQFSSASGAVSDNLADLYFAQGQSAGSQYPACPATDLGELASSDVLQDKSAAAHRLDCGTLTDLSAALVGLRPSATWLTRLEMRLPRSALSMDCNVTSPEDQREVSSQVVATKFDGRPSGCPEPIFESRIARERGSERTALAWLVATVGLAALARRARTRR